MANPVYLTINEFPGTGAAPTVVDFNFAGGYISPAHVKAEIFNPVTYLRTPVAVTDDNFVTAYRLSLPVVVPTGSILRVYRDTPKDQPLVDFTNGARIAENNLDLVAQQAVFVAAESADQIEATQVADVLQAVEAAALSAAAAQADATASAASAALSQAAAQEGASIAGGFALASANSATAAAASATASSAAAATSAAEAAAVRADLTSPTSGKGDEMVATTAHTFTKVSDALAAIDWAQQKAPAGVNVLRYIPPSEWPALFAGSSTYDATADIQAALDAVISRGNADQRGGALYIPALDFKVTALRVGFVAGFPGTAATKDAYNKTITCHGRIIGSNPSGAILTIEGAVYCDFNGLRVENTSTGVGAIAVKASRCYICNWNGGRMAGGEFAFLFQGNMNNFNGVAFNRASLGGFAIVGATSNCVNNNAIGCDFEDNDGWGIYIKRTSGASFADLVCRSCYFERNDLGHVRIENNLGDVSLESCYLNMSNTGKDGIVYAGTLITSTANRSRLLNNVFYFTVAGISANCVSREAGTSVLAMGGVKYRGNSMGGLTNANTVLGFTEAYSGSTNSALQNGINEDAVRYPVAIKNPDFATLTAGAGSAPTDWTAGGGAAITSGATISHYGHGNKIVIANSWAAQTVSVKANTLYRITCMADVSVGGAVAGVQVWNAAVTVKLWDSPTTNSTTPARIDGYWFSGSNTSAQIFLREVTESGGNVCGFSELRMIDVSN
jgi:hypothetical protein